MSDRFVTVCDVAPRDGLQNEQQVLPVAVRAELVERIARCGVPRIEAVSFVSPGRVPQMADAEAVVTQVSVPGTVLAGLVLNERGYDRLATTGLQEVHLAIAASDTFNQRNSGRTVEAGMLEAQSILGRARADGRQTSATVATAFGCPFEGDVDAGRVLDIAARLVEAGAGEIVFADTVGVGVPRQVRELVRGAAGLGKPLGVHLHNTRNTGYANAYVAVEEGVALIDASVGGIGGCPFAPRATGNIGTEDLVALLHREGVETGIDIDGLVSVSRWLEHVLGKQLDGYLYRAWSANPSPIAEQEPRQA